MPLLRIESFDGIVPRTTPSALRDNQAQVAENVQLYGRELRAWGGPTTVATVGTASTIYKLYNYAGASQWLHWTTDVDVARSPVSDTSDVRYYYTGDGVPKKATYSSPGAPLSMGLPAPVAPPSLTLTTDGTGTPQTRAYVWTYVSQFGSVVEESAQSPSDTVTVKPTGSHVTVTLPTGAPSGAYNVTAKRLYRSVTGANSDSYQFVVELPLATATYDDHLKTSELGAVIDTIGWVPPPNDLKGLTNVGSGTGVLAGFFKNTICFSQPFYPHAWPVRYQLTVPYEIVGLGTIGSSVVVLTKGYPYIIDGGTPGAMSMEQVPILEPCISKGSITSDETGVLYASPNGLVAIGPGARNVVSTALYKREEWEEINPDTLRAEILDGRYFGITDTTAIVLDRGDTPALSTLDVAATLVYIDQRTARVNYLAGGNIYVLDANPDAPLTYTWKSKRWVLPRAATFSAMKVDADYTAGTLAVKLYDAGVLIATLTPTTLDPFRIPPFRTRDLEIELVGTRKVRSLAIATSVPELRT